VAIFGFTCAPQPIGHSEGHDNCEEQKRDRRLKLLKSAANSARFNGATVEQTPEAFEAGLREFDESRCPAAPPSRSPRPLAVAGRS